MERSFENITSSDFKTPVEAVLHTLNTRQKPIDWNQVGGDGYREVHRFMHNRNIYFATLYRFAEFNPNIRQDSQEKKILYEAHSLRAHLQRLERKEADQIQLAKGETGVAFVVPKLGESIDRIQGPFLVDDHAFHQFVEVVTDINDLPPDVNISNIVINQRGKLALVDFDPSQAYREDDLYNKTLDELLEVAKILKVPYKNLHYTLQKYIAEQTSQRQV